MKIKASAGLLLCCALTSAITVQPSAVLFENEQVKVIRAYETPHVKGKFHSHARNRVLIYLQSGRQRFEYQDGRAPEVFDWKAGEVKWSDADGMHSPETISDQPFNIVEIELKTTGTGKPIDSKLDPLKIDPEHYKLELENNQVRVFRAHLEPHVSGPLHEHSLNRVMVFLTDQDFRSTDSNGKVELIKHQAGDAIWRTSLIHTEENVSDQPFEVIAVEIKN
jgi:uncharacterized RmlC-like cupin family protein